MRIHAVIALGSLMLAPLAAAAEITPIGAVQGSLPAGGKAEAFDSPMLDKTVTVQGVVTGLTLYSSKKGDPQHGFFLQNTVKDADKDPNSSDGIYIFTGRFDGPKTKTQGGDYAPKAGDEIVLSGKVTEFHGQTQLAQPVLERVVRHGVNLDKETPAVTVDPPAEAEKAGAYWERVEGMRVTVPAGALAQGGLHEQPKADDWWQWMARTDRLPNAGQAYAHRMFRDAHPLDNHPEKLFDDGNGYKIILSSWGVRAAAGDAKLKLPEAHTFDALAEAASGPVLYSFDHYVVVPQTVKFAEGADPYKNMPPADPDRAKGFSVASYNMENLYDLRDNPASDHDVAGDPGSKTYKPPFNYVPASQADYDEHLKALAKQVIENLHCPDIILGQELENQDICRVADGKLVEGKTPGADGKPDTAQEVCLAIKAAGGPEYDCAADPAAGDDRGIIPVYFYRTDRVELAKADGEPMLSQTPPVKYAGEIVKTGEAALRNPRAINAKLPANVQQEDQESAAPLVYTRAPQVAVFKVYRKAAGKGAAVKLYALDNHLSSIPNKRVTQRTEQARLMAAIITAIEAGSKGALALSAGDFNIYPRPDDPFADKPSDQLGALYEAGLTNVYDTVLKKQPAACYSYVYEGEAQTLDQMFLTPALKKRLLEAGYCHINADYPEGDEAAAAKMGRRASDHDPLLVKFSF